MRRLYVTVLVAALALYLATMAPGVLWQDCGLAQVRVLRQDLHGDLGLALSHPLYYLLAIAFQALPLGESALKTNLVSAVFGAATVANVFLLIVSVTGCRRAAVVGSLSLAVAHTFWQHCALAEVYTVSTALLTAELLCLWRFTRDGRKRWLVLLFLLNGLGIANHMLASLSLACYAPLALWLAIRRQLRLRVLLFSLLAWTAGAGVYLGMIAVQIKLGAAVGATIHSALFGKDFAGRVLDVAPSGRLLLNSALVLAMNFPTPSALLVISGLAALGSLESHRFGGMLAALLVVHLFWAVRYDVQDQYTFFIPAVVLLAALIGLGACRFLRAHSRAWTAPLMLLALLPAGLYPALPAVARGLKVSMGFSREVPYRDEYSYFLHPWKTRYDGARRFAQEVCATLPDGSVLLADSATGPPIHYLRLTGRCAKDLRVWPPQKLTAAAITAFTEDALKDDLAASRVYVVSPQANYCPPWLLERYEVVKVGLVYRVSPRIEYPAAGAARPP